MRDNDVTLHRVVVVLMLFASIGVHSREN